MFNYLKKEDAAVKLNGQEHPPPRLSDRTIARASNKDIPPVKAGRFANARRQAIQDEKFWSSQQKAFQRAVRFGVSADSPGKSKGKGKGGKANKGKNAPEFYLKERGSRAPIHGDEFGGIGMPKE